MKTTEIEIQKARCKTCQGQGMWGFGLYSSMGPGDARSGYPTLPCPECGADANPIEKLSHSEDKEKKQ